VKVIIVGAGKVGTQLVESLLNEKHEITVIDSSQDVIDRINDFLDVLAVRGNGVSGSLLKEAGCEHADLLIAVTDSSKFEKDGFAKVSNLDSIDIIVTDNSIPEEFKQEVTILLRDNDGIQLM